MLETKAKPVPRSLSVRSNATVLNWSTHRFILKSKAHEKQARITEKVKRKTYKWSKRERSDQILFTYFSVLIDNA